MPPARPRNYFLNESHELSSKNSAGEVRLRSILMSTGRRNRESLELLDCDVVEYGKAVTAADFAFNGDGLGGVVGELIVQRVVAPDEQINSTVILTFDPNRQAFSDASLRAFGVFRSAQIVSNVASHIENFAGDTDFRSDLGGSRLRLRRVRVRPERGCSG
jgi:hypothetical protein